MSEYDNSAENIASLELENQFIMRFPQDLGDELRESIEAGNVHEKLTIQLESDMRHGEVRMNDQVMHAKIVDLPTIVESYKTTDNVNLYKTADISQMLVCSREPFKESDKKMECVQMTEPGNQLAADLEQNKENNILNNNATKNISKADKEFHFPDGITPPTRNIRKRRLKNKKNKTVEPPQSDVLKEVRCLLRMDSEAVRVEYELVDDDGTD